jgi:hypothetical protein
VVVVYSRFMLQRAPTRWVVWLATIQLAFGPCSCSLFEGISLPPDAVTVSPTDAKILIGDTVRLVLVAAGGARARSSDRAPTWASSDSTVASVHPGGLVTGLAPGHADVCASLGPSRAVAHVTVGRILIAPRTATVPEGEETQLSARVLDPAGRQVADATLLWTSMDTQVASVDSAGRVLGMSVGTTRVVVKAGDLYDTSAVVVSPVVLVGAGDIAECTLPWAAETASLLDSISGVVFTLGDNAYPIGSTDNFARCYAPTWGRQRWRTRPSPGNHDYMTAFARAYYKYFGALAGDPDKGYYSYDIAGWHIIALNTSISDSAGSLQERWLRQDLGSHPTLCALAYMHFPLFSSGHYAVPSVRPLWQALYDAGADVVLAGHDHVYERFAPKSPDGAIDFERGIRQFTVGTGGNYLHHWLIPDGVLGSQVRNNTTHGVLKLTLHRTSYAWQFIPITGDTFSDSGTAPCH